jgi:DNA-binding winged helix-turn-helix (wHTH) protein/predicted ATPase/class 3 adenylate cyclase
MRYIFGDCVLDTTRYVLHRAGQPMQLRRKVFQMLVYLLAQRHRVVPKQELCEQVWPKQFISDATLESTLATVRRALGDTRQTQRMIQTLWGYGYRFVAPVEERTDPLPHTVNGITPPVVDGPAGAPQEGVADALQAAQEIPLPALAPLPEVSERKLVTVLCCAPCPPPGPPERGDLDTLHQQVQALYAVVQSEAQPYGGTMQPVLGEHVLVVFGAPAAQEDHAQRAVLVALSLQQRLQQASPAPGEAPTPWPPVRMSVHTGMVAVGGLRQAAATAMGVVGETVTQAVALQTAASPGMLLCSEATARLVRGVVRLAATSLSALPGLPTPVYQTLGLRPHRALNGRRGRRPRSPFVGRQQELATLQAALAQAEAGQGQVVGIVGEPGLGKSRLLYEFRHGLRQQRLTYLAASCLSYAQATPYGSVRELLCRSCRITAADPSATIRAKVHRGLAAVGLAPEETAPYLLHLLEVPAEAELTATHSPQALRARTIAGLVQLALAGARQRPLVLVVENLQWLDPSSEEVLTVLAERLAGAALLLLVSYRPGYRLPWIDRSYVTQVALSRLSPANSRQVVRATLGPAPVVEASVQAMVARAAGNPFFLEELARAVREHDAIHGCPVVPETVQGVLAARIDRLPPVAKYVLQVAAVIGKDVPIPLLHAVAEVSEEALEQDLRRLQAAEFLEESGVVPARLYTFRHILVQEVAYQSLLADARKQLHQRTAQVLAARFAATVEAQPELVARHYTEAGHTEQAIAYWQRAGMRALQHSANREAIRHLTRGLALLATLPKLSARVQQELDLLIALGPALMATRGQAAPEVEQTYARARALCAQIGETPKLFPTLRGLCRFYQSRGPLPTAREFGEQLYRLAQCTIAPTPRLEAYDALGTTLFLLGEYPAAQKHLEQGITLIDPAAQKGLVLRHGVAPGVRCLALAALTLWCLGYPLQAMQRSQEALALAQALDHFQSLAYAQHNMATMHHRRRETPALQAHADALLPRATAQGFPLWVGHGTFWQGWTLVTQGQGGAGLVQMRQGLAAVLATGQVLSQPYQLVLLAEAAGHVGQIVEGLHWLAEALTTFAASGRGDMLTEAYRLQGEFLLRQAAPDIIQAEACFEQALAVARRQQAKSWELRAAMSLARLQQQQDKCAAAYELLAPVYGWFTEGFDTADLQEAKALLDELQ